MIVNTESLGAIMFSDQEYQRRDGADARANVLLLQHWIYLGFNFMFMKMRVTIGEDVHRSRVWKEVYMVVGKAWRRQKVWCLKQGNKFSDEGMNFRKVSCAFLGWREVYRYNVNMKVGIAFILANQMTKLGWGDEIKRRVSIALQLNNAFILEKLYR